MEEGNAQYFSDYATLHQIKGAGRGRCLTLHTGAQSLIPSIHMAGTGSAYRDDDDRKQFLSRTHVEVYRYVAELL